MPYRGVTVFAEDTYGVLFHRKLIAGLENKKIIPRGKLGLKDSPPGPVTTASGRSWQPESEPANTRLS